MGSNYLSFLTNGPLEVGYTCGPLFGTHLSLSLFFFLIAIVACVVLWALIFLEEIKWGNYPHAPLISLFFILRGILSFFH